MQKEKRVYKTGNIMSIREDLNPLALPIRLSAVHSLASLLNLLQHVIVGKSRLGGNIDRLGLEADIEGLDA